MDPNRDNPLVRFATFWWGLGAFLIFAAALAAVLIIKRQPPATLEDAAAAPRYRIKAEVDAAQAANLPPEAVTSAIPGVARKIAAAKPVAVEKPEQVVPGSPTAAKLAAAPVADTSAIDAPPATDEPVDPAVMEIGKVQYMVCAACHGQNGEGGPIAPPIAGSEWVTGPVSNLIRIQLRGLNGPITVAGKEYNFAVGMAAMSYQTDEQIAAVLTYIRNNFGNKASAVKPEQVAALRSEVGKPPLTVADLIQP
jgi:mono/diheme cytochrome c family protein